MHFSAVRKRLFHDAEEPVLECGRARPDMPKRLFRDKKTPIREDGRGEKTRGKSREWYIVM